jgi:hypothetical protein
MIFHGSPVNRSFVISRRLIAGRKDEYYEANRSFSHNRLANASKNTTFRDRIHSHSQKKKGGVCENPQHWIG